MENENENYLDELQESLYAQAHHDSQIELEPQTEKVDQNPLSLSSKSSRYWQNSKQQQQNVSKFAKKSYLPKKPYHQKQFAEPKSKRNEEQSTENEIKFNEIVKSFVPYSSVLSFMAPPAEILENPNEKTNKIIKFPKIKQSRAQEKEEMKAKYAAKVKKAEKVRLKYAKKQLQEKKLSEDPKTASINIESSSEDEVVLIPVKAPPVINLDSSDDEEMVKLKRPASPSTSSMISDDFIVCSDKSKTNNPFMSMQQANINDRIVEALNEREKLKKIKKFTKVSSTSSSARSSCDRSFTTTTEIESQGKVKKSKRKAQNLDENDDTIYASKAKVLKKKQRRSASGDEVSPNVIDKSRRRKISTASRKKSSESETEKDPRLEYIEKCQKRKSPVVVVEAPEISTEIIEEIIPTEPKELECEIIETPQNVIYEITDEEEDDLKANDSSDDSMKNFKGSIVCDLSLNVTQSSQTPHEFAPIEIDKEEHVSSQLDCEVGWNDEMKYFYNECNYGRDFILSNIVNAMPQNPKLWPINHADRIRAHLDREKRIRCHNCNEIGHIAVNCKRPKKRIVCYMCGEEGHRETRCPNSICLRCGKYNRIFSTTCSSCYNSSRKVCPLCHYKGHDIELCPDKWRRYHSTTTEVDELDVSYKRNDRVYCSICARSGHFADNCGSFQKAMAGLVTSNPIKIISNKNVYSKNYSFNNKKENDQVMQLMTYLPCYKFNFKFPSNCQFYPRFREYFQRRQHQILEKLQQLFKNPQGGEKSNNQHFHDDNSNYSFSEFYKATSQELTQNINITDENKALVPVQSYEASNDFIPLQDSNKEIEEIPQPQVCDAKIMLTKEHSSVLMSTKAQNFLFDLGERCQVKSQFRWDSTGNSLIINGLVSNQNIFHDEIRNYLYQFGIEEYTNRLEKSTQAPRIRIQVVNYLQSNLNLIKKVSVKETKRALVNLIGAEKKKDHKKAIKYRKSLNIIFMGYSELREGALHIGALRKILLDQKKEIELGNGNTPIDLKLREEINKHVRYIFTAVNHGNYQQLFEDFQKANKQRANQKVLQNQNSTTRR